MPEENEWPEQIYTIATNDKLLGGKGGPLNKASEQLDTRTAILKQSIDEIKTDLGSGQTGERINKLEEEISEIKTDLGSGQTSAKINNLEKEISEVKTKGLSISQKKAYGMKNGDAVICDVEVGNDYISMRPEILKKDTEKVLKDPVVQNAYKNYDFAAYAFLNPVTEDDGGITVKSGLSNVGISLNNPTADTLADNTNIYYSLSDTIYTSLYDSMSLSSSIAVGIALINPGGTANGTNWINIDYKGNALTQSVLG